MKKFTDYLPWMLFILGAYFFTMSILYGKDYVHKPSTGLHYELEQIKNINMLRTLSKIDRENYQEAYEMHAWNAKRNWDNAKNACWILPNISHRNKAKYVWVSTISAFAASEPKAKIVAALLTALAQYGLDCIDEWGYIDEQLEWCEYHYTQAAHYASLLQRN